MPLPWLFVYVELIPCELIYRNITSTESTNNTSSDVLLSPDILQGSTDPCKSIESDGFYLLKKDLQRRTTLSGVLTADKQNICKKWKECIYGEFGDSVIDEVRYHSYSHRVIFY